VTSGTRPGTPGARLASAHAPSSFRQRLLDLVLPPACLACGSWMGPIREERRHLCPGCASRVRGASRPACRRCSAPRPARGQLEASCPECDDWPSVIRSARFAAVLAPPADDLVHALKYGGWPEAADEMARTMLHVLPPTGEGGRRLLVPVPTTRARARRRGYNQAEVLARALARRGGGEVHELLRRTRSSESQVALHRAERMANVSGAFSPVDTDLPAFRKGDLVVLIDDVLTTGATASAAARALGEIGVEAVHLATYGRALPVEEEGTHSLLPPPGFFEKWIRSEGSPGPAR
jgi:ComF family protein